MWTTTVTENNIGDKSLYAKFVCKRSMYIDSATSETGLTMGEKSSQNMVNILNPDI